MVHLKLVLFVIKNSRLGQKFCKGDPTSLFTVSGLIKLGLPEAPN